MTQINLKNASTGQSFNINSESITGVIRSTESTMTVYLGKVNHVVYNNDDLLPYLKASVQLDIFGLKEDLGQKNKIRGMTKALNHANLKNSGDWGERAYNVALMYIKDKPIGFHFMFEDVRNWAEVSKLIETPPSKRAWGSIPIRLAKNKFIIKSGLGIVKNPNANKCYANMWKKI